jgi:hypothetical protein
LHNFHFLFPISSHQCTLSLEKKMSGPCRGRLSAAATLLRFYAQHWVVPQAAQQLPDVMTQQWL